MHLIVFIEHLLRVSTVLVAGHTIKNKSDKSLAPHLPPTRVDIPVRETNIINKINK